MANRVAPTQVHVLARDVINEWMEYAYPFGENGPQFRVRLQDDGTYLFTPVDRGSFAVHPDDERGVRFRINISVERME